MTFADGGIVASTSHRAAAAGLRILQSGGNAFDAAIAVAGVEWLTLPGSCGLGGDVFAVLYDAREDRIAAVKGSGLVGSRVDREYYTAQGLTRMPLTGWHAAAVPGAPHAYATIADTFGTRPLGDLLSQSLAYAENGITVSHTIHEAISDASSKLAAGQNTDAYFSATPRRPMEDADACTNHPVIYRWRIGRLLQRRHRKGNRPRVGI
jgi:gamma-glutamyltranspeptidase/glutathione hydrolase